MNELSIARSLHGELLGPESSFAVERSERRKEWVPIVESSKKININSLEEHRLAVGHGRLLQQSIKNTEEFYKPIKQEIYALKKLVLDAEKADRNTIDEAKTRLSKAIKAWRGEQTQIHGEMLEDANKNAESLSDSNSMPIPSIVQCHNLKMEGSYEKTVYRARVDDLQKLIEGIAKGQIPIECISVNQSWLNDMARDYREGLNYPGVTVFSETSVHFRG